MKGVERNEEKNGMGENEMGVGTSAKHCIHMQQSIPGVVCVT